MREGVPGVRYGSESHKALFCDEFLATHERYEASGVEWPVLDDASLRSLRALPVWNEAVNTELETAAKVRSIAETEHDPKVAAALDVQAYEERRHSELLANLTGWYGIDVGARPARIARRAEWNVLTVGHAECLDSFLAFGIYRVASDAGVFHPKLIEVFDTVMQEDARNILFFENWLLWRRRSGAGGAGRALSAAAVASQLFARAVLGARAAVGNKDADTVDDNFLMDFGAFADGLDARAFIGICLDEHERRLGRYDRRLARPRFAPTVARGVLRVLPTRNRAGGATG
jgi:hypothetical protein